MRVVTWRALSIGPYFPGFIKERAALAQIGKTLGPAYLFTGCRREDQDYIYRDELEAGTVG